LTYRSKITALSYFCAQGADGPLWIEDHVPKDTIPFADKVNGPAFIVERCYMGIVSDAIAQGLNIEQLRWVDGN
jgi:hypothetical protein